MVHAAKEDKILKWLVKYDSNLLLMHHRFPTSTINVARAAHPFSTKKYFKNKEYILVHNGGIRNAEELFCDHQELGIEYYSLLEDLTFNDSEALLWDFALFMEGKQDELKATGNNAFICLKLEKGKLTKMYFGRNSNPLNMLRTPQGISLSSEGEGEAITPNTLYTWNYRLRRLTTRTLTIPGYVYTAQTNNYGNYHSSYTSGSYADDHYGTDYGSALCDVCDLLGVACSKHRWDRVEASDEKRLGGKIGNVLQREFGHLFGDKDPVIPRAKPGAARKKIIEYEQDPKTQKMVPAESLEEALSRAEQLRLPTITTTEPISEEEVTTAYLAYLATHHGNFEQTYWLLEWEYLEAQEAPVTAENMRNLHLIEKVMERITTDPEYEDEKSISNLWEVTWTRK